MGVYGFGMKESAAGAKKAGERRRLIGMEEDMAGKREKRLRLFHQISSGVDTLITTTRRSRELYYFTMLKSDNLS